VLPHGEANKVWAVDPDADTGGGPCKGRRDLILEEEHAFWGWAAIEVLRHTGIRLEELLELSHHSFVQYRLPSTGEVVPLLQIAPSKTDQERLILVVSELADVLSAIVHRIRKPGGSIPVIPSYDRHERTWLLPMPLLFQRPVFTEHRPLSAHFIRDTINMVAAASGLTDTAGMPLRYAPHDFRRLFVTDAIMNGLPPHIAQVICGHGDINTTMGYKKPRELHQAGEKPQVARSARCVAGLSGVYIKAI
jgi:site-specific recombinase XerD